MPGTWADVLSLMSMLNNELEVSSGEGDEAVALVACIAAQHQFEAIAASYARVLGTVVNTTTTTALAEKTTFPSSLLRLDGMQLLDANGVVVQDIEKLQGVGAHAPALPWPLSLASVGSGSPAGYFTDMANFYWLPLPDAAASIRIYGLFEAAEPAARANAFTYRSNCKLPIAQFATLLLKYGVDDAKADLDVLGDTLFRPLLKAMQKFDRSTSLSKAYEYGHST